MKIAIRDNEKFYSFFSETGFYGIDVEFEDYRKKDYILSNDYTRAIEEKRKIIEGAGLKICQTHLTYYPGHLPPIGNGTYQDYEAYMLKILKKEIQLTNVLGCKVCAIHLYFEEDKEKSRDGNIALLSNLLPVAEKYNVVIAIENIYAKNYCDAHLSDSDDLLFYIDYFKNENLKICFDTGHAIICGQNPVEMFKKIKKHVAALHLHTTVKNIDLHSLPYCISYGEIINWDELYKEIVNSGYRGAFNMEVEPPDKIGLSGEKAYYLLAYEIAKNIVGK